MATDVKMPRLSLTMEVGTVIQWLKAAGDTVAKGDDLAEIETDKVNVTMEAPASGYLRALLVDAGVEVPCDTTIAVLTDTADEPFAVAGSSAQPGRPTTEMDTPYPAVLSNAARGQESVASAASPPSPAQTMGGNAHVNASPAAKNLARQLGVDISTVVGSGPSGRVGLEDVQRAAELQATRAQAGTVSGDRRVPLGRMRAAIAQRMTLSATTVPQFVVRRRVDLSAALRYRDERRALVGEGPAPGVIDLIHLAVSRALLRHPEVNASFDGGERPDQAGMILHDSVHLGIAVALPDGLVVPVIRNAHTLSLEALARERRRLQEEALGNHLAATVLSGATFTVSNLGPLGVDEFSAIVNPPEAAILAVGRMQDTLIPRDGATHSLPMMVLTVTADHRVLDGAGVARFLDTVATNLEHLGALP
ncbi:MAG: catalytic domain of component of various dehydrogenase complexe [Chloroflexi bacterium]|nr:catalytic domain of component of various dehydrogenase complexe [Chloroflexota bacterium]